MSKPNVPNFNEQIAQGVIALNGSSGGNDMSDLASLLKARFMAEDNEKLRAKEEAENYRQQQIQAVAEAMSKTRMYQESCPHLKPNRQPNTNGQRDHQGHIHLVCSNCGKEFDDKLLSSPQFRHLNRSSEVVGGPQV